MLTSTMTRPTTISPTTSCDTKVYLIDTIDIAPIPDPKPRIVSLEPISRRARAKSSRKRQVTTAIDGGPRTPNGSEAPPIGSTSDANAPPEENEYPRSPSPSDVSFESQMSSGNASGTEYGVRSVNTATEGFYSQNASRAVLKEKTITATIDVSKGGFLRGDQIPIKITVKHTKHVRSLKGIIITLYRQARVDMHPALPVVPNSKGDKTKSEEYYPKSRTGLGGLSLSSAGSSHLFRKDLCQSFAPLFVDPRTLTAEIKCAVRVPDEAFPTISNVPGAMISFKYYVEVVVDIQGKLTGLDRMVANAGLVNVPTATGGGSGTARDDPTNTMFSTWGGNFVDTDQIRREKGVVSSLFEVVIGTKDSERNGKRKQTQEPLPSGQNGVHEVPLDGSNNPDATNSYDQDYYGYDENGQYYDYSYDPAYYDIPGYEQHPGGAETSSHIPSASPEAEQEISEKERMRRAEARLLPSQPPYAAGPASPLGTTQHGIPASAPILSDDEASNTDTSYIAPTAAAVTPSHLPPPFQASASLSSTSDTIREQHRATGQLDDETRTTTTGSSITINGNHHESPAPQNVDGGDVNQQKPLPALPPQSSLEPSGAAPEYLASSSSHFQATDDKQELRRQRLEMERSAPPEDDEDQGESSQRPSAPSANGMQSAGLAPSAPFLDDDDEGLVGAMRPGRSGQTGAPGDRRHSEALPEYQR
ncbi:ph-response sensor protein [Neocucurbitaria cava]|uniref:Ph-response sensor protein n=1 Tax=Neocucurbitaria cava TaxID=798079 RepID=A0A9W8Y8T2_9PLEO|nr:ph-response sensor protein [Neocucurbitaria cava]